MTTTFPLLLPIILLLVGLTILVWSADLFVEGAASTAVRYNVSPLVIGVVIMGFGTSSPEIVVSIMASLEGNPNLAIGNSVGSNITNIGLILGMTALLAPVLVKSSVLKRELPILLIVTALGMVLILNRTLGIYDGLILLSTLVLVLIWMIRANKNVPSSDPLVQEINEEIGEIPKLSKQRAFLYLIGGLVLLIISSRMMVSGAVDIAQHFQVPDLIIGLTIVAIGTSLPELASSIAAALKNEVDMVVGNILGSNLFNITAVLAVPAILAPHMIDSAVLTRDYPIMIGFTIAMLLVALPRKGNAVISRIEGFVLLSLFVGYLTLLYFNTVNP
ncbi:MAG: calcium/sodium antiporter [Thiomicrospira sp.]